MSSLSTGADPSIVGPHLARALDDPRWAGAAVALVSGGKSNLTYRVTSDAGEIVLRRPPLGNVLPTAHDMVREHTVLAALAGTPVPVPRPLHLCTDTTVLGAPFYVMEYVPGPIVRGTLPTGFAESPAERTAITHGLVDTLATLHGLDPAEVGLTDFGRPDGYLARQVSRWTRQWTATADAVSDPAAVAALNSLAATLAGSVPSYPGDSVNARGSVVHGDFRIDNTVLDAARPGRVAAVLDWEMSTLGDPLADLGLFLVYWSQPGDTPARRAVSPVGSVTALPGFGTRDDVAQRYAEVSGRDLDALPWYVAFGAFKLAVVVAGIVARHRAGAMVGDGFADVGSAFGPLVDLGHRTLSDRVVG
jgi:aminoglycoside phosphotransferase (APT) family kinase protein